MSKKKEVKFEGRIEPLTDCKPFYMVVVENGVYSPNMKHDKYEDAFQEMLRLSKKENKKAQLHRLSKLQVSNSLIYSTMLMCCYV